MKCKRSAHPSSAESIAEDFQENGDGTIHSDVLGSYTGTGEHGERPIQDADDL